MIFSVHTVYDILTDLPHLAVPSSYRRSSVCTIFNHRSFGVAILGSRQPPTFGIF